jgi:hypothetical protein
MGLQLSPALEADRESLLAGLAAGKLLKPTIASTPTGHPAASL